MFYFRLYCGCDYMVVILGGRGGIGGEGRGGTGGGFSRSDANMIGESPSSSLSLSSLISCKLE